MGETVFFFSSARKPEFFFSRLKARIFFFGQSESSFFLITINKHLAFESILADCQHGFRSQRSCETQLVQFVHDLVSNLDRALNRNHRQTDVLIISQRPLTRYHTGGYCTN